MDSTLKLALLVVAYTIGTICAYGVIFAFGEAQGFDWRFCLGEIPQASICILFGVLLPNWSSILLGISVTSAIDLIFFVTMSYFAPEVFSGLIDLNEHAVVLIVVVAISALIYSSLMFTVGYTLSTFGRWASRRFESE